MSEINGKSIEDLTKDGLSLIMEATKCVNAFPSGSARQLYSAYPAFSNIVEITSQQLLATIDKVLKLQNIKGNIQRRDNDERFELLLECNDLMLERINSNLDELSGIKKNPEMVLVESEIKISDTPNKMVSGSWNDKNKQELRNGNNNNNNNPTMTITKLLTAKNIIRPQCNFKIPVDNRNSVPFEPQLKYKPNSIKPLAILPEYDEDGNVISFLHPYEFELDKFEPRAEQLQKITTPIVPKSLKETELLYIETVEQLNNLMKILQDTKNPIKEIAVDVEHHSYRTFQGIACLMQISTRNQDFIIDTLALRDELVILNEVFTNPNVVKVFHGADSDVEWLQRDLSIYLVNIFDTHQAAKHLNLARLSLQFLLKHYCDLDLDKTFQLADWRIRPLPEELITYARQDTHYLLYVYDLIKNDLINLANGQDNIVKSVYQLSKNLCKKRYIKPKIHQESHMDLYAKSKRVFDNRQLFALQAIFMWRDKIARQEDESYGYVLPNHMMLHIAEILPREMQGILACCNPIPPLVRQHLNQLHQFVLKAREQPLVKPIIEEQISNRNPITAKTIDISSLLYCPHDLTYSEEFRDDLPVLLSKNVLTKATLSGVGNDDDDGDANGHVNDHKIRLKVAKKSVLNEFYTTETSETKLDHQVNKIKTIKFVSPYARYLAILPLAEKQRLEELAHIAEQNKKKKLCPEKIESMEDFVLINKEIKKESKDDNADDDIYSNTIPLNESGKRKRNEFKALITAALAEAAPTTNNKRFKIDVNDDKQNNDVNDEQFGGESSKSSNNPSTADGDDGTSTTDITSGANETNKKNKKRKKISNNKTGQRSDKPIEFDYKNVDFKQFQGGSKKPNVVDQVQSKFHGKNKNKRGQDKKFNKLFTFSKGKK